MPTMILTGRDTLTINGRNIVDYADGTYINLSHPNQLMTVTTGKNGATIFAKNEQGVNAQLELRVLRGSSDDRWLSGKLISQDQDPVSFGLMNGTLVKHLGTGVEGGQSARDTYTLEGGVFTQNVDTEVAGDGSSEQGVSVYTIQFASSRRTIG